MSESVDNSALQALEGLMEKAQVRGQWQVGSNRPENAQKSPDGKVWIDPVPLAHPYRWAWTDMEPILEGSCTALPQSNTARRSLLYMNPGLARGTTQTIWAGIQIIQPGEIAWAHRHSVNALRFTIQGGDGLSTVVDGEALPMHPYDLILTPGWCWHDHHNQKGEPAIWLDVLDVPFIGMINQNFYEELGESVQDRLNEPVVTASQVLRPTGALATQQRPPYRYPWAETRARLEMLATTEPHPANGIVVDYVNPITGGATLSTLACSVQMLPPGFTGTRLRRSASAVHFVIDGAGEIKFDDTTIPFAQHDGIATPNWTWHQFINTSKNDPAFLFTVTDRPILDAFGLYREQAETDH